MPKEKKHAGTTDETQSREDPVGKKSSPTQPGEHMREQAKGMGEKAKGMGEQAKKMGEQAKEKVGKQSGWKPSKDE